LLKRALLSPLRLFLILTLFLGAVITTAPASLMFHGLQNLPSGIQYKDISGTFWRGNLRGVSVGSSDVGEIAYETKFGPLLLGQLKIKISSNGQDIHGDAVVSGGINGTWRLSEAVINTNLASVGQRYRFMGSPLKGMASLKVADLIYNRHGCVSASGDVWTDLLQGAVKSISDDKFDLAGPLICDEGALKLTLTGENTEGQATVLLVLTPDLRYTLTADVSAKSQEVDQALRLLGFEDGPSGLVYDASGVFKGV